MRQGRGSEWFYNVEADGRPIEIRGIHMASVGSLLAICSDADYWRGLYPKPHSRTGIDVVACAGLIVRECWAAESRKDADRSPDSAPAGK